MSPDEYFDDHIPHRVNLLIAFRQRYSGRDPKITLGEEAYRDRYRCAKDMSFLMVRFFCSEMGILLKRRKSDIEEEKSKNWLPRFGVLRLSEATLKADRRYADLRDALRAANRAVAHIDDLDVDHPFKTKADEQRIFGVIDWIEDLLKANIYQAAGRDFKYSMSLPNNVMY